MIEVTIFYIHVVFFVYMFCKNFVEENFTTAFLTLIFMIILFSVGWTASAFLINLVIPEKGLSRLLTKAAFSLTLLTFLEIIFYKFYLGKPKKTMQQV